MADFLSALLMVALMAASAGMWWRIFQARKNSQPHCLDPRESGLAPLGFLDLVAAILITASSQVVAMFIAMLVTGIRDFDFDDLGHMTVINFSAGTAQLIAAGITLWYLSNRYGDARAAGLQPGSWNQDIKLGFYGFLLFIPPMLLLQAALTTVWEYEHPTMDMVSPESPLSAIVSAWWAATIVAPVSEEVLFRVVLLGWLLRCFANPHDFFGGFVGGVGGVGGVGNRVEEQAEPLPDVSDAGAVNPYTSPTSPPIIGAEFKHERTWAPVFIVALLFALVHIGQGPAPIPIFFLALGLCYIYRQTGSVVPCIVLHFLLNTFSMTVYTIEQFFFPEEPSLGEEGLAVPVAIVEFCVSFFKSLVF